MAPGDVEREYGEAIAERVKGKLLYLPADGADGIFVATVRALVHAAALTPAMGSRKVIVVGNAERMVPQEGAEYAANAFLKMLEEPPGDVTIILTSSTPGALLPTIRSRVIAVRIPRLSDEEVAAWVRDPVVRAALDASGVEGTNEQRAHRAAGAPGALLGGAQSGTAMTTARGLVEAATRRQPALRYATVLRQGSAGARGAFAETLAGLTTVLHAQLRSAVDRKDVALARAACRAIADVEEAKTRADGNANPQLVAGRLVRDMATAFGAGS
jgi:DNA polymerase-3 subunit delta'